MRLAIRHGRIVDPSQKLDSVADILIDNGKVVEIGSSLGGDGMRVIDAAGCLVLPGLVDMHCHLRDPGQEWKEDIVSGSRAAAKGGFTTVVCMANTDPPIDDASRVRYVIETAGAKAFANVYPVGAVSKGLKGEEMAEIGSMARAGAVAVSDDGKPVMNAKLMRSALEYSSMFEIPVITHAEDLNLSGDGDMHYGLVSTTLGLRGIPPSAEEVMVARDILLCAETGARLHVAHVSTKGAVELVREAKRRGISVTAEVTPHHLVLSDGAVRDGGYDADTKVNPPLRSQDHVDALVAGLIDGTIDSIATDHAPHAPHEKQVEYEAAPFGISGLETAFALMFTRFVCPGILSVSALVRLMSLNPSEILRLGKGSLKPGSDADLTVVNPALEKRVDPREFESKGKNTPFKGMKLRGWPVITIVGGVPVLELGVWRRRNE